MLFLDELNRARPELLQAVQDLTLNRTLAGRSLPVGSVVIAAVNQGEVYQLTDLDPALVSRFNVYEFAPSVEDWSQWANSAGVDARVRRFIQRNPQHLDGERPDDGWGDEILKTPDRRAWVRVSDFVSPTGSSMRSTSPRAPEPRPPGAESGSRRCPVRSPRPEPACVSSRGPRRPRAGRSPCHLPSQG